MADAPTLTFPPEGLKVQYAEAPKKKDDATPFAYGGPAGRAEFLPMPNLPDANLPPRVQSLIHRKRELINTINTWYGREDARFRRNTDLVKVGGADAAKTRDGLSGIAAVITEHGLYSQEATDRIQMELGNIDRQIEEEKQGGGARRALRAFGIAAGVLAGIWLFPILFPALPVITPLVSAIGHALGATGFLGFLVSAVGAAISGAVVASRRAIPANAGFATDPHQPWVDPETPAQARGGMLHLAKGLNGLNNLPDANKLTALGDMANQNSQILPRTHRTTQPRGI